MADDGNTLHLEDLWPVSDEDSVCSSPQKAGTTRSITDDGGLHKEVTVAGEGYSFPEAGDEVTGEIPSTAICPLPSRVAIEDLASVRNDVTSAYDTSYHISALQTSRVARRHTPHGVVRRFEKSIG
jgi:hypothetical protein